MNAWWICLVTYYHGLFVNPAESTLQNHLITLAPPGSMHGYICPSNRLTRDFSISTARNNSTPAARMRIHAYRSMEAE